MPTNLEAPHGATIAYSRLCLMVEAATDHLVSLSQAMEAIDLREHLGTAQADAFAETFLKLSEAQELHLQTKAWATADAPVEPTNG